MSYTTRQLASILEDSVSWLSVRTADSVPGPGWVSCAELVADQQAGGDPTYGWRKALQDDYGRQYAVEPPVQIAAMFTLMWYVQVPSLVAGVVAAVTGVSPDVSPASLAFRRHPTAHYPVEVALLSSQVVPLAEAAAQLSAHTTAFLESYRPGVKLGSLQRFGAVKDELRQAIRLPEEAPYADQAAAAFDVSLDQKLRTTCCYFYALPNIKACTTCPRFR
ncbi:FhuF-like iron-sulfur protein [Kribbella antiqua]|uniref:FhuF-like iron-sulfur protein n=1 Tax=Kribbella antiqua TaxID=2512217 RepID=A0A4R2IMZ4_9ACTN|nr:(2Fe-2S)-binding protein [Kribbella antiqua]TCO45716.1 FhuF-like iron-sulfur protein [Kribbella antiqua]